MSSKTKNNSKKQSRLSKSDLATPPPDSEIGDEDLLPYIEEASSKYPSLIGKSAFIGRVIDVQAESRGCKIWLSESSMVASSLATGTIVSVSLASPRKHFSHGFPLSSFADECYRDIGIDYKNKLNRKAGNFFVFATVFPSNKVIKDGVRLSSNLSYSMGCPISGRVVFVYPVRNQSSAHFFNGSERPHKSIVDSLKICNSKELYLELVSSTTKLTLTTSFVDIGVENARGGPCENGSVTSPRTPLYQSKLSSSGIRKLNSPICQESASSSRNENCSSADSFNIKEVLMDENAKKLLEACAARWLYDCSLLQGNIVVIPMLSEFCTFHVVGAKEWSEESISDDLINNGSHDCFLEAPKSQDDVIYAFAVNHQTKIFLHVPLTIAPGLPQHTGLSSEELESKDLRGKIDGEILKLGGLSKEYAVLKDIIISSTVNTLSRFGLRTTKGVLLHGPPGTGKTSLARLCAQDSGVNLFALNGPEIISQYYGESEQALHRVFDSASHATPAVVFIDELDAIAPARKDGGEALSQRIVATLLNLMDGISRVDGLLVIAATNRPDSIEPALRRPGRLDREIEIGVPSPKQRLDILYTLLREIEHSLLDIQVQNLAMVTHGFVGADLAALCNEAVLVCLRRFVKSNNSDVISGESAITYDSDCVDVIEGSVCLKDIRGISRHRSVSASSSVCSSAVPFKTLPSVPLVADIDNRTEKKSLLKVVFEDFEKARMKVRPSAMREVILEVPKIKWEDVGGQKEVKTQLMEAVEWPQKHQDAFERIGTQPPTGILLFGPPGCSKTLMARAVASEAGLNFLAVKGPELYSKWVGESEKAVRSLFAKARANAPSIIFFDEIDGLAVIRGKESDGASVSDRVMSQLLVELDGLHQRVNVTVIAATNRPDKIDPAILRPGRFDRLLYVGPPNDIDREEIFRVHLRKIPCSSDVNLSKLAFLTRGCTGADISLICREAALAAMEESLEALEITMQHLRTAIRRVNPSKIESYKELSAKFERLVISSNTGAEIGYQQCSALSTWFTIRNLVKTIIMFLQLFPTLFSLSKSASSD